MLDPRGTNDMGTHDYHKHKYYVGNTTMSRRGALGERSKRSWREVGGCVGEELSLSVVAKGSLNTGKTLYGTNRGRAKENTRHKRYTEGGRF